MVGRRKIELRSHEPAHPKRTAVELRYGAVEICRPQDERDHSLPPAVGLRLVDVREVDPPKAAEPLHWRLLTTHAIADPAAAWEVVGWYQRRWVIEQLFRVMKSQGLQLEDSQLASAERLVKLAAAATKAACVDIQLTQGRDGTDHMPASNAFTNPRSQLSRHSARRLKATPSGSKIIIPYEVSRGSVDHRTLGWMELLLQAAGADHLPARQGVFPCDPSRQTARNGTAMRCENPLELSRG